MGVPPRRGSWARRARWAGGSLCAAATLTLTGCGGNENALDPAGEPQRSIAHLWWWVMTGAWIGFAIVCGFLFLGWVRRNRSGLPFGGGERAGTILVIGLGVVTPLVLLTGLFFWSNVSVLKSTAAPDPRSTELTINVVGHQWWWEVRYAGSKAVTANEIHIPVGARVNVVATTADVIHSFWVPELNRKIDTVPGKRNRLLLQADRPGVYSGECSEFCGLQHAHMTAVVVAEPPADFRRWLTNMARPARTPTNAQTQVGRGLFLSECGGCHQLRGSDSRARIGPDLTHVASRMTLAAGTLPNTPETLAAWIADPQHYKPGAKMPQVPLTRAQLADLVAYLRSLE
jgi:cytochrome c oxidase subunit II